MMVEAWTKDDSAMSRFMEEWRAWTAKALELGVANLGATTTHEIKAWAEQAAAFGCGQDARLAHDIADENLPLAERCHCFVTSICRMQLAFGLLLRSRFFPGQETHDS
jgi:hypothetical protein